MAQVNSAWGQTASFLGWGASGSGETSNRLKGPFPFWVALKRRATMGASKVFALWRLPRVRRAGSRRTDGRTTAVEGRKSHSGLVAYCGGSCQTIVLDLEAVLPHQLGSKLDSVVGRLRVSSERAAIGLGERLHSGELCLQCLRF